MKRNCEGLCPYFQKALDILAKPWSGLILATLEHGPLRFSEINERIEPIGDRILSTRLKELESQGVVKRHVIEGPPVRVEYELTDAGKGFRHVADAIGQWGAELEKAQEPSKEINLCKI